MNGNMSYEPSYRRPPRQDRRPNATPNDGWPAYANGSYGATGAYRRSGGYDGGYEAEPGNEFPGPAGYLDDDYPDDDYPDWDEGAGRNHSRGGAIAGAVRGLLAVAVAIGVATLAATFVRPQASPIIAVGDAFIDRTPPAVKNFAFDHFGQNEKTALFAGMYVAIAGLAMVLGVLARRNATIGVTGIAVFGLLGAFVAITRPESRSSDVIPSAIGTLAGIAAFLWLSRVSARVESPQPAYSGHGNDGRLRRTR